MTTLEPKAVVTINDVMKIGMKDIKGELAQGHAVWFSIHGGHVLNNTDGPKGGPKVIPAYDYKTLPANQKMGHALAMVGYQTAKNGKTYYLLQNSWVAEFGDDGFAYIDEATLARNFKYAYILDVQPVGAKRPAAVDGASLPTKCKPGLLPMRRPASARQAARTGARATRASAPRPTTASRARSTCAVAAFVRRRR